MFRLSDNQLVLSASDLSNYLACGHLTEQRRAYALGEREKWHAYTDPHAELTKERGDAHEKAVLQRLSAELGGHVDLTAGPAYTREALEAGAAQTVDAMREGAPLIFQAQFFDGRWQGRADFLRRVEIESDLGPWSYEVLDTKLARQIKPAVVHQLSLYSRLLGRVQGVTPAAAYLILGDGTEHPVLLDCYAALHRHATRQLEYLVDAGARETYPEPTAHCAFCPLDAECRKRRRDDDHLSLVAGASRAQRDRLTGLEIETVADLAAAPADLPTGKLDDERFDLLRHQAMLQVATREDGGLHHRQLTPVAERGYALLPVADAGDLFFDLEGDPYIGDGGVEYLWGWCEADGTYSCVWAHDAAGEKAALEAFVDLVMERRLVHPAMRVFHYAPHEASKLRSLALKYGTREAEIDTLLAGKVLVDLYAVVRQGLQVGEEGYGLKKLERHTGFVRTEKSVREGGGSIVAYETWLETGAVDRLEAIRAYNADDCRSTLHLRDWLLDPMKPEAAAEHGCDIDALEPPPVESYDPPEWAVNMEAIADQLLQGLPADATEDTPGEAERRSVGNLMLFHRREAKPEWWRFFELCKQEPVDLIDERDAIGGLVLDPSTPSVKATMQSTDWTFTFPPQEHKLDKKACKDPKTRKKLNVESLSADRVVIRRRTTDGPPTAQAIIGSGPVPYDKVREALAEFGQAVLDGSPAAATGQTIVRRDTPRLLTGDVFEQNGDPGLDEMKSTVLALDASHLVVQGPPGTGKTYRGARMVVAAMSAGRRVAVTAPSHAAIHNLLEEIEMAAHEVGLGFTGVYKGHDYTSPHGMVETVTDNKDAVGDFQLVAGTAWLLGRPEHRDQFGVLFIDEAGQFSLANALAVSLAAESVVLLGDPQQLPQVTKASHPGTAGASVMEHVLDGANTVAADRGYFLTESWRMHPDVCAFVAERSYDPRLHSRPACGQRRVDAPGPLSGAGLRSLPVVHTGRSQSSPEEAAAIAAACRRLLDGGTVTDDEGVTRQLTADDIMVVAPYNLAVRCIREHVPAGVRVGTVDKFQGGEAPVVFFAMTCSSGEDVPRGLDFLFSKHRLNVAVSRAQCLAVLVHNPQLLDADCKTLEAMQLVDGACRFVELAAVEDRQTGARAA